MKPEISAPKSRNDNIFVDVVLPTNRLLMFERIQTVFQKAEVKQVNTLAFPLEPLGSCTLTDYWECIAEIALNHLTEKRRKFPWVVKLCSQNKVTQKQSKDTIEDMVKRMSKFRFYIFVIN